MSGTFHKKSVWNVVCLFCGLFLIGLFLFIKFADSEAGNDIYTGIVLGAIISIFSLICLTFNRKAFVRIEDHRICAKYHWFGKLDYSIDEVDFALAQINTLSILLKNGKRHVIMGLTNPGDLCSAIRREVSSAEKEAPGALQKQLEDLKVKRKKELRYVLGGIGLMFAFIFMAVLLTGGRDPEVFRKLDWVIMAFMGLAELLSLAATFYAADRAGKLQLPMEQLYFRLRGAAIATQRIPSGTVLQVYTDPHYSGRLIVFGFPNDPSVYYCVQEFSGSFTLKNTYTSEIYPSLEDLPAEVTESLMDITAQAP